MLARETFYLRSNNEKLAKMENLKFGCGLHNDMQYENYRNNKIAGIMGLGSEDLSFVNQLGPLTKGRFSYCLPFLSSKTSNTYLRFGDDKFQPRNAKSTPLYTKNETSPYYLELQGISLNKSRLNINPKVFALKNNGRSNGCIIDSGTLYSRIISPAFDILNKRWESTFRDSKAIWAWNYATKGASLKGFHFRGSHADFVMKAEAVFEVVRPVRFCEYFCLAMMRDTKMSIVGNHQQTNHRIIHDLKNKRLIIYPDDCSKNP